MALQKKKNLRIGIDARFYGSAGKGLGRYTEKLIDHLELLDKDNDYFVFLRSENFNEYAPKNPRFKKVLARYPWYSFSEQFLFPLLLLRFHLDLAHFPHFNIPFWYTGKFVVTIHDLILLRYPTILNTTRSAFFYFIKFVAYRFVIACAVWRAKHIITVSHFTKEDILKHYVGARGKISVTYEAADAFCRMLTWQEEWKLFERLKLFDEKQGSEPKKVTRDILKPYILYVGNAYPHKNLEALLSASVSFSFYTFVLVGKEDYFYARLKKTARDRGIKNILFADFVDDRELNTLYRFAVCYIFPSLYEGFGLPPLEAMARGLPVISSDQGALPEILGDAAHYFNPHVRGSLEKELAKIFDSEEERAELVKRGYQQAARYNWESMTKETLKIYIASIENK